MQLKTTYDYGKLVEKIDKKTANKVKVIHNNI